jgi:hypothetical protein
VISPRDARRWLLALAYLALLATYVALRYRAFADIEPRVFNDTPAYVRVAERPLASPEAWLASRPFLLPLIYKAVRVNPRAVVAVQWSVSVMAWAALAATTASLMRSRWLRPFVLASLLAFGSTGPITQWDGALLSESLALSLTAVFVAGGLRLADGFTVGRALLVCATGGALVFTRYVEAYRLLVLAGLVATSARLTGQRRLRVLAVAAAFVATALVGAFLGQAGERWIFSSLNVLAQRILVDEQRLGYFVARGLPVNGALMRLSGQWASSEGQAFTTDPELDGFRRWWKAHGKATYLRFLLSRPGDAFMAPLRDRWLLISPALANYAPRGWRPALGGALDTVIYPSAPSGLYAWAAAVLLATIAAFRRHGRPGALWLVPAMLLLSAVPFAFIVWHSDAMEIGRHAFLVGVHLRLGLLLTFWLAIDRLAGPPRQT